MNITWLEYILFSMAAFRLTRLFVYDQITDWIRSPFMQELEETDAEGKVEVYVVPKENGLRGWIGELLNCYWCTGIWVVIILFCLRWYFPMIYKPIIIIFAVAGLAAVVETIIQKNIE